MARPIRVLMLHGLLHNAKVFESKLRGVVQAVHGSGVELVFVNAVSGARRTHNNPSPNGQAQRPRAILG